MPADALRSFFGGFVRLHILYHAAKEPIWGVEIMEELRRHGYNLSPGTVYPILHQLSERGYLTCRQRVVAGRRRKEYTITPAGRRLLSQARDKLRELVGELLEDRDRMAESRRQSSRNTARRR